MRDRGGSRGIRGLCAACALLAALGAPAPGRAQDGNARTPGLFSVRDHGAAGDGKTLDTAAIQKAIEACAAAGGGQVRFPPGAYLSGTVYLKSKVTLYLDAGATLVGTKDLARYRQFSPPAGTFEARLGAWHRALILGEGVEDVAIAGPGRIDGNKVFDPKGEERMRGPHTILMGLSRGITLRDFAVEDAANYAVMLMECSRVDVSNVTFTGGWDGVHFRGWPSRPCRDVRIVGCRFFTGDDSIAGRYWENVLIAGCVINSSCNGIRVIGPAAHLVIHDCLFYGPGVEPHRSSSRHNMLSGIILQPGAWDATQGALDDVLISDATMRNVASPVTVWTKPGNTAGEITITRMSATGVYRAACSFESWAESPIERVVLRDVSIEHAGGGTREQAALSVKSPPVDARPLPAWGLYARNVKRLELDNVRLRCAANDLRPLIACEGLEQLALHDMHVPTLAPRCLGIDVPAVKASACWSPRVRVENGSEEGFGLVALEVAGAAFSRWVWLRPDEKREVVFENLAAPPAGTHEARAGDATAVVVVEP